MGSRVTTSRVAVVTGGASGIGLGCGEQLLAAGHKVALLDLTNAENAAADLGAGAIGIQCDVSDRAAVAAAFEKVRAELGPVGILVTSAGIESFTPIAE